MLNENAQKWVEALRSDRFKQTKGTLHDKHGHCCLGVGCVVAIENGIDLEVQVSPAGIVHYDKNNGTLPEEVASWLNLNSDDANYYLNDRTFLLTSLAEDNDAGKTFEEIANIIESEPKGMFNDED